MNKLKHDARCRARKQDNALLCTCGMSDAEVDAIITGALAEPEGPEISHADLVQEFQQRVFSGQDLLMVCDILGVGAGATMHAVKVLDRNQRERPDLWRAPDFPTETVDSINEALFRLEGLDK